jgi:hypothetical protein
VDRSDRLILLAVVVAFAVWRLVRFLRLGLAKRRSSLGIAGGWMPPSSEDNRAVQPESTNLNHSSSLASRIIELLVTTVTLLVGNLLIWLILFGWQFLKTMPPAVLGIAWIFANFYLVPFARRCGRRSRQRIEIAKAQGR